MECTSPCQQTPTTPRAALEAFVLVFDSRLFSFPRSLNLVPSLADIHRFTERGKQTLTRFHVNNSEREPRSSACSSRETTLAQPNSTPPGHLPKAERQSLHHRTFYVGLYKTVPATSTPTPPRSLKGRGYRPSPDHPDQSAHDEFSQRFADVGLFDCIRSTPHQSVLPGVDYNPAEHVEHMLQEQCVLQPRGQHQPGGQHMDHIEEHGQ